MALSDAEKELITRLDQDQKKLSGAYQRLDEWYELEAHVQQLGIAIPAALHDFETIANWCRVAVDAKARLLRFQGVRFPGEDKMDPRLAYAHQANDLDEELPLAFLDALIFGRAYGFVGTNDDDPDAPLVTLEAPIGHSQLIDPRTRRTTAHLRRYEDTEGTGIAGRKIQLGTLYQDGVTKYIRKAKNGRWVEDDVDEHGLEVPVVALTNRARLRRRHGVSEMTDVIPLVSAAARALTNLQVGQETHALPQRAVLGASKGDFIDPQTGQPLSVWQAYFGAIWALQNKEARIDQFAQSDLRNFHETIKHYALLASGITHLPAAVFGFQTDNPASAEAIRGMRLELIADAEWKTRFLSGQLERLDRLVLQFLGASEDDLRKARSLESVWDDPSLATRSEKADYIVKLTQGENPVLSIEAAWDELGFTETRKDNLRRQLAEQRRTQRDADLLGSAAEAFRRGLPAPADGAAPAS